MNSTTNNSPISSHRGRGSCLALFLIALAIACDRSSVARSKPSVATASALGADSGVAALLRQADVIFLRSSDSADVIWSAALRLADSLGDSASRARALTGKSKVARYRLQFAQARSFGEEALAIKLRLGMRSELSQSYNALGLVARDDERLSDALGLFAQAIESARAVGDSIAIGKAEVNTGLVRQNLGDFAGARVSLERGRSMAESSHDSVTLGRALTNLAALDIALGDALSAVATLETARRFSRQTGDALGESNALGQLATAYDLLGEAHQAFAALDSAIALAHRQNLRLEESDDLKLLGDFYQGAGDHVRALDAYRRATQTADTLFGPEERGNLLRHQARSQFSLGRLDDASRLADAALRTHGGRDLRDAEINDRLLLAELSMARNDRRGADAQLRLARESARRVGIDAKLAGVALAEGRIADQDGDSRRVLRALASAREVLELGGANAVSEAAELRMRAYARLGQLDAAAAAGRQAVAGVERLRSNYGSGELRTSFSSARTGVYADLAIILLRIGRTAEAFEVSDAARGRALLDHLATVRAEVNASRGTARAVMDADRLLRIIDSLVARLRELERESPRERGATAVAATQQLADSVTEIRSQYEALQASLTRESDALVLLGSASRSTAQVQASLREDEALLEYFVTPTRLLIFVVRHGELTTVSSEVTSADLMRRTRLARDLMARPHSAEGVERVLKGLHALLLGPVFAAGRLRGVRHLIVARHSMLAYLP
ncbi:MAG: hypothetical protein ABIT38_03195, partial [Gemmatimonadaceae bacterium]